jgi:hypothetical protein
MSVYLLAVVWERPKTRGQVQRIGAGGQRLHPRRQVITLDEIFHAHRGRISTTRRQRANFISPDPGLIGVSRQPSEG